MAKPTIRVHPNPRPLTEAELVEALAEAHAEARRRYGRMTTAEAASRRDRLVRRTSMP
jgi:hypothetical protein